MFDLWQHFNYFPDNQLIKLRVYIGLSRIFITPPLNFNEAWRFILPDRHKGQKDKQRNGHVSLSVCLFVVSRWSLTHMAR